MRSQNAVLRRVSSAVLVGSLAIPALSAAQGVSPEAEEEKWTFAVGAYLQAVDINGTTTVGDMEVPTEVSFTQLIDKLQGRVLRPL